MFFSCVIRFPLTIQVLLITVQCGSIGLNLVAASHVIHMHRMLQPREGGSSNGPLPPHGPSTSEPTIGAMG